VADQSRQTDRPEIDEWNPKPATEHSKHRIFGCNAQIAPEREL
jgi:hypothetical protein